MRTFKAVLSLMMLVATTGTASAQMNFTTPVFTQPNFTPAVYQAPQWAPGQSAPPQSTVTPNFSVVQFNTVQVAPMQAPVLQFQPLNYVNPVVTGGGNRVSRPAASAPRVSPAQAARAARTSLSRFSQGLDSL